MYLIILTIIISLAAGFCIAKRTTIKTPQSSSVKTFAVLAAIGLIIRIAAAALYYGHQTDVTDFMAWSDMVFKDGIPAFYLSDSFTDYPPGYMYVLWVIGLLKNTFSMPETLELILVKLPAIIADLLISIILFSYLKKKNKGNCAMISALFLFNPAIILNSSLWGQVDSVMTLLIVVTIILLSEKRTCLAYFAFALAVFVKPQALMFTPLLIYAFFDEFIKPFDAKKLVKNIGCAVGAAACVLILSLPFGISNVISQYTETLSSYPYATVNAFNLWAALGQNWADLNTVSSAIGTIFLTAVTLASFYILFKNKDRSRYFFTGAFLCFSAFMLSVKMHERYAYPAMALMLFAFALNGDFKRYILYMLLSMSQLFNTAYILFIYETDPSAYYNTPAVIAASVINVLIFLYLAYSADRSQVPFTPNFKKRVDEIETSQKTSPLLRADYIAIAVLTAVYAVVGFSSLGDRHAPESEYVLTPENEIVLEFEEQTEVASVRYFLSSLPLDEGRVLTIKLFDEAGNLTKQSDIDDGDVFFWSNSDMENAQSKILTLSSTEELPIKEIYPVASDGSAINVINADNYKELFDEQDLVPPQESYTNSTYFDEIYHARTAYEFINELPVYEWTHPPLGKVFISLGIRLFGMNPFGWRCVGVLFGVMMVPLIYLMSKLLFKKTWLCCVVTILFSFDFMHYVQTRISTIDVYVTFFIMLMYYFMFKYAKKSFYDTPIKNTLLPLGLSGIAFGLAAACKWTGFYAAAGLCIIFFTVLYRRYIEYRTAKKDPYGFSGSIPNAEISGKFPKYAWLTISFCLVFFIVIPVVIYGLSYIPYLKANGGGIDEIIKNQIDIFTYHSKTVVESKHAYASPWYSWPLMLRPIWYYSNSFANGLKAGISAFGNPLVWWVGIPAAVYNIILWVKNRDKTALFLIIAYAANFLPWSAVTRTTFIYHYFPSVPFVVLMIGYSVYKLSEKYSWTKKAAYAYAACTVLLFILFYPVLTGLPTDASFVETFLRWLPGWVLI